jgi:hypothetical protein
MEKAPQVHAIRLDCRWHDLGSFVALAEVIDLDERRNLVVAENRELLDSRDNIVVSGQPGHLVACIGVKNMLVVHSTDATLVCPIEEAGRRLRYEFLADTAETIRATCVAVAHHEHPLQLGVVLPQPPQVLVHLDEVAVIGQGSWYLDSGDRASAIAQWSLPSSAALAREFAGGLERMSELAPVFVSSSPCGPNPGGSVRRGEADTK